MLTMLAKLSMEVKTDGKTMVPIATGGKGILPHLAAFGVSTACAEADHSPLGGKVMLPMRPSYELSNRAVKNKTG